MTVTLADPDQVIQLALPAWMVMRITSAMMAAAVDMRMTLQQGSVYVQPSERRAFELELKRLADIGHEMDQQVKRQRPEGLVGISEPAAT